MKFAIIGSNGMLSVALTKFFYAQPGFEVDVYGLESPNGYSCTKFHPIDLLKDNFDYDVLMESDVIVYAAGAGVQAGLKTEPSLMYALNVSVPIEITLQLRKKEYKGKYISFGSYMEIGLNDEDGKAFTEEEVVCSPLPVTNDYALSKRLYGRYMKDFRADFKNWHFILPNMFSSEDLKPGTRLVPYVLKYLQDYTNGKPTEPQMYSPGTQTRQYITLEEVMVVLAKAIQENIPSGLYCIGGGEFLSIRSLIERLYALYGVECKEDCFGKSERRDGDIKSLRIDGTKLKAAIGYLPHATIEEIFKPGI